MLEFYQICFIQMFSFNPVCFVLSQSWQVSTKKPRRISIKPSCFKIQFAEKCFLFKSEDK